MRSTLHLKFIIVYIIFGFLSIFTVATLTFNLTESPLEEKTATSLYREASLIASNYLPAYFDETLELGDVRLQLSGMEIQLEAAVWFVGKDGTMITSAEPETYPPAPRHIEAFNPAESGGQQYLTGNYHDYFEEDVMTVLAPVVYGYTPNGYLLIHKYTSDIRDTQNVLMHAAIITVLVIYLLSFMILLAFQYFIYRPLRKITEAATQYASGNLEYEIPVNTEDEMGYLSASLNYMSAQLGDMEDYQKKIVANVSHDFRSPLTSIRGYVEAMTDGTIPPELHEKYLNIILFETERLTDLTNDLLTLNEFDTKELLLDKTRFDIQEMIKKTAASFEGVCIEKRVSIELLLLPEQAFVLADSRKIQQVLYNLIDNAIKFSENDDAVKIEVTQRGGKVFVSVKDSGIGISKREINKIWERFYKSDASRGKDKKGTGLGLSIVKEAILAHDEHINVISTEGVGTEFIFSLARAE